MKKVLLSILAVAFAASLAYAKDERAKVNFHNEARFKQRALIDETGYLDFGSGSGLNIVPESPSCTSAIGYQIYEGAGRLIFINCAPSVDVVNPMSTGNAGIGATAGVTVTLYTPTSRSDGRIHTFVNVTGTTQMILYAPGLTMSGGTAVSYTANRTAGSANVTSCTDFLTADALGDTITVRADYDSAVSWWVLDSYIH